MNTNCGNEISRPPQFILKNIKIICLLNREPQRHLRNGLNHEKNEPVIVSITCKKKTK